MVAISFSVFKEKILNGEKRQTIRPYREQRYKLIKRKGILQLYWKQMTKECEFLMEVPLKRIDIIRLYEPAPDSKMMLYGFGTDRKWIYIWNGKRWEACDKWGYFYTITLDGFITPEDFYKWFDGRYGEKVKRMNFMRIQW